MKKTAKTLHIIPTGSTQRVNKFGGKIGECEHLLNMRERNESLEAVGMPKEIAQLSENEKLIFIHDYDEYSNYLTSKGCHLILHGRMNGGHYNLLNYEIHSYSGDIKAVNKVGGFLIVDTLNGREYLHFINEEYVYLDINDAIPTLWIGTADSNSRQITVPAFNFAASYTQWARPLSSSDETTLQRNISKSYKDLAQQISSDGFFMQPMAVRYAVRLWDDTYLWISAPVIVGNCKQCTATIKAEVTSTGSGFSSCGESQITAQAYHVGAAVLRSTSTEWDSLIKSIDIFSTTEMEPFTDSLQINYRCETSQSGTRRYYLASELKESENNLALGELINPDHWHILCRINDLGEMRNGILCAQNISNTIISESGDLISYSIRKSGIYNEALNQTSLQNILSNIRHDTISECATTINGRIYCGGKRILMRSPWQNSSSWKGSLSPTPCKAMITVKLRTHRGIATKVVTESFDYTPSFLNSLITFPDSRAYSISIKILTNGEIKEWECKLTGCDNQGMAYFINEDLSAITFAEGYSFLAFADVNTDEESYATLSISAHNNPFITTDFRNIGDGKIINLCATIKSIYSSVFGRYPLYAFTTKGIYAVAYKATGDYKDAQLISHLSTYKKDAFAVSDDGVYFVANDCSLNFLTGKKVIRLRHDIAATQLGWGMKERELYIQHNDGTLEIMMPSRRSYRRDIPIKNIYTDPSSCIITTASDMMLDTNIQLSASVSITVISYSFWSPIVKDFAPIDIRCNLLTSKALGKLILKGAQYNESSMKEIISIDYYCTNDTLLNSRIFSPRIKNCCFLLAGVVKSSTQLRYLEIDYT